WRQDRGADLSAGSRRSSKVRTTGDVLKHYRSVKSGLPCSLRHLFGALALLLAANSLAQPASQIGTTNPSALRVLILSGGGGRDWRSSTLFLRQLLEEAGRCEVRVCESP